MTGSFFSFFFGGVSAQRGYIWFKSDSIEVVCRLYFWGNFLRNTPPRWVLSRGPGARGTIVPIYDHFDLKFDFHPKGVCNSISGSRTHVLRCTSAVVISSTFPPSVLPVFRVFHSRQCIEICKRVCLCPRPIPMKQRLESQMLPSVRSAEMWGGRPRRGWAPTFQGSPSSAQRDVGSSEDKLRQPKRGPIG